MKLENSLIWLGDESSLRHVVDAQVQFRGRTDPDDIGYDESSHLLSTAEGVGTVAVHGPLTNSDSFWNRLFGITSYNEIRNAIIEAINDDEVDRILLDMDTPGGDAKGVNELSDFILQAKQHKPIDTYVSGAAFSAGYWIASATDKIYGPKMSEAGSIGVVAILMNQADALKDKGYQVTVLRGGKFKALGNPYEKLTDTAKKIFQAKIDVMEGFFLDAVSENRNIPRASVKSQVGEGLTFFAKESVANGLMDEVISFDTLFNRLINQPNQGSAGRTVLSEDIDMKKKVLTAASVAALASGAPTGAVEDLLAEGDAADPKAEGEDPKAEGEDPKAEGEDPKAEGEGEDPKAEGEDPKAEGGAPAPKADASESTSLIAHLKGELATLRAENKAMDSELTSLRAKFQLADTNEGALKKLASEYIGGMAIGLGMSSMNLSGMETSTLLAQYTEVRSKFTTRFQIGASAEVEDGELPASSGDGLSFMERASIATNKL
jgi:signal peptide peptidase SppA